MTVTSFKTNVRLGICVAVLVGTAMEGTDLMAAPPGTTPFGVYDPNGAFNDDNQVDIEHLFLPWEDVALETLYDADIYAFERDRNVIATIEPWTWTRSARNTPQVLINGIRNGEYDENMQAICSILSEFKSPVTVRWAQEMEDKSGQFIWSNWEPSIYVNAYRRMIDICRAAAPEVQVMWSPLGHEGLKDYYPGDDYVDIIGLSVFGLQAWEELTLGREQSFKDIFGPRYNRVAAFGKPIIIAELGYVGDINYVTKWDNTIRQNYPEFPNLEAVVYFNQKEVHPWPNRFGYPDWQVSEQIIE